MPITNLAHEFVYDRVKEQAEKCDGDAKMLASIRTNRKLLHNHAVLRMNGEIQTKFIIWLWSNTWEEGRLWTSNAIPLSKIASRLNCEKTNLILAMKGLLETGFVKRTPAENRSFRYCLDFECDWMKFVIALDEEITSEDEDVHNSDSKKTAPPPIGVDSTPIDSPIGVESTPINGPIYNASYRRYLETLGGSPLFQLWKGQEGSQEVIKYTTDFIKSYKLDYGCGIFLSKQPDMLNVLWTLRHAHKKLVNGFKPSKSISAWVTGLVKRRVGREHMNREINTRMIKEYEIKFKLKIVWTKQYVRVQKGVDVFDIQFKSEPQIVESQLQSLVNYIRSISGRGNGSDY